MGTKGTRSNRPGEEQSRFGFGPSRLAAFATRRPKRVLAVWGLLVLLSLGLVSGLLDSGLTSDGTLTNHPESLRAKDLIDSRLPSKNKVDDVIVVRSERTVVSDPAFRQRVSTLVDEAKATGSVQRIRSYLDPDGKGLVSQDRHATMLPVVVAEDQDKRIEDLVPVIEKANAGDGYAVTITGKYTLGRDFATVSQEDLSNGEVKFGLPAALIVLLLVFGTVTGAMIPMLMAILSIVVSLGITSAVGQVFELNLFITNMIVAMGLALGIDYSLFIVSRLREERHGGSSTREAIMTVANTATRAVVFSGTAFTLAMVGMLLVPDTTLRSLGFGAVLVGLVSIAVALTFHPAVLMVLGDRVDRTRLPWLGKRIAASAGEEGPLWRRAILAVLKRPALSLIVTSVVLLAAASPLLGLKVGASGSESLPDDSLGKQGLVALQRDFARGATDPVNIVVAGAPAGPQTQAGLTRMRTALAGDRDFAANAATFQSGPDIAVVSVPLTVEPSTERASEAVTRLRDEYVPRAFGSAAENVFVGGGPAEALDSFEVDGGWLPIVIAFVLVLSLVLLTVAFRSIVIPLTAIGMNLLSVGAAYGILVLVFQEGVGADLLGFTQVERIEAWVPIFLFSVLFGLSMDYQVFLLSRIRERWSATGDTEGAIVYGVASTARLITGAAAIIIVVFTGFASGQLVSFQEMGFGIAIALALDATLVRLLLIPAAMKLLGERNWYLPRWLEWLPHLSIEGGRPEDKPARKAPRDDIPPLPPRPLPVAK
jgi:RND superfamily putative drug exporter